MEIIAINWEHWWRHSYHVGLSNYKYLVGLEGSNKFVFSGAFHLLVANYTIWPATKTNEFHFVNLGSHIFIFSTFFIGNSLVYFLSA